MGSTATATPAPIRGRGKKVKGEDDEDASEQVPATPVKAAGSGLLHLKAPSKGKKSKPAPHTPKTPAGGHGDGRKKRGDNMIAEIIEIKEEDAEDG
ncbi:hypothetical protein LTR53_020348, partial [Teratosphaeriaceae sp. CCFEE 6253]